MVPLLLRLRLPLLTRSPVHLTAHAAVFGSSSPDLPAQLPASSLPLSMPRALPARRVAPQLSGVPSSPYARYKFPSPIAARRARCFLELGRDLAVVHQLQRTAELPCLPWPSVQLPCSLISARRTRLSPSSPKSDSVSLSSIPVVKLSGSPAFHPCAHVPAELGPVHLAALGL
ncbi:uncharacterized protein [Zea mays]|uniref:uncharacterized protein n=1 Tax=Zea mays TaxID=4577 RepID=UPI000221FA20|nr:uncharacterized protein LOC109939576 [Zea mays]|eukprot:XP_020393351.1 uncharacterized protein LOC109939576 [Zea mays]